MDTDQTERPDFLALDDIDVLSSVTSQTTIEQNEHRITDETIGAMDPLNTKIVVLGNTIYEDGVIPRFFKKYKDKESWDCFRQPLIDEDGNSVRPEVFDDDIIRSLKDYGDVSFNQNYLLIPYA